MLARARVSRSLCAGQARTQPAPIPARTREHRQHLREQGGASEPKSDVSGCDGDHILEMVPIGTLLPGAVPAVIARSATDVPAAQELNNVSPICQHCNGAGYYTERVPFGHPHFGVLFPCACKLAEWEAHRRQELLRLSNLDAFRDLTFATFDPKVKGVRRAFLQAGEYAQRM